MPKLISSSEPQKTIGFVAGGIGDQLYHFTQLEHLAQTGVAGKLDLVCMHNRPMRELASGCAWIGDVIDAQPFRHLARPAAFLTACKSLKERGYDRAVIFHRSTSFKLAARLAGIPLRIGLSSGGIDNLLLNAPVALSGGGGRRQRWGHRPFIAALDQYFAPSGLSYSGPSPIQASPVKQAEVQARFGEFPRPWTIVNLFVGDALRRWPPAHAQQMIRTCYDRFGGTVFLNTGPDALDWHDQLASLWSGPPQAFVHLLPDEAPIPFMIALYRQADLYLGVDSFTANLALNCDLPAVILFNKASDSLTYRGRSYPLAPAADKPLDSLTEDDFQTVFSHFDKDRQT